MGQKVNPISLRLGIIGDWRSRWYAEGERYAEFVLEDARIRRFIESNYPEAGISKVEIERGGNEVIVTVHTARPGMVIGRGGQRVEEIRRSLEGLTKKNIRLNIQEIRQAELDAHLVAKSVAGQLERNIHHRRALKQAVSRTMQAGAKGIKITCSGRLGGAEIARSATLREGRVPLHTLRADVDHGFAEAVTLMGRIGVKVWIYKGDILPPLKEMEIAEGSDATAKTGEIPQSS